MRAELMADLKPSRPPRGPQTPGPAAAERPGLAARRVAFTAVAEVIRRGASLDDVLGRPSGLEPRDDALARAIAVTTFRRFGTIWAALEARLAKGIPDDERAFALLAIGAAQILFLDVPDHSAVDLSVALARSEPNLSHVAGLANAVLRRVSREYAEILKEAEAPIIDAPSWLAQRWTKIYGPERASGIAAADRLGATVDVTVKSDPAGWAEKLGGTLLPTGSIRLPEKVAITDLPGYEAGEWWVQDAAAALPARFLAVQPGWRVADLCAAPGGKTAQLAAAGASVIAVDRSAPRLERLKANMTRLGLSVDTVCADALAFANGPTKVTFDAVLLDAPCTATGTIRRHPDVAWTKRAGDLAALANLQTRLLNHAAGLVRPGGTLVYCVCSLEPEEGESQAITFLERHPEFTRDPIRLEEVGGQAEFLTPDGDFRTAPDLWPSLEGVRPGLDGFFATRLVRRAA
jgi:16S rRNA (cytosine967-C5)-methyltransferase